jgi:hypothetical protein
MTEQTLTGQTLTEIVGVTSSELAKVPLDASIYAVIKMIKILTGVDSGMDISGATKELQTRLDTLAGAMKNQSTQLKAGETAAEFTELLAAAIKAANDVGSEIGPPLADKAQDIIIELFKFSKSTAANLIELIPVVGEVFDVLRIINSVVSTTMSSVNSFVTSADLLMDGFDKFVDKMSSVLTESDSELLTTGSYNKLVESDKFREKFRERFGVKPPPDFNKLNEQQTQYVIKSLKAQNQLTNNLRNPETLSKLLQGYADKRLQHHKINTSSLKAAVKNQSIVPGVVPLDNEKTISNMNLNQIHQNATNAAREHNDNLNDRPNNIKNN